EAFCSELDVREVPVGYAVRTPYSSASGDAIGFYIVRHPTESTVWRFEDSGMVVPLLEAEGISLESGQRGEAFARLLAEHDAEYDDDARELHSRYLPEADIPAEASRFVALLLRMQDFALMHADIVASTFRDDV